MQTEATALWMPGHRPKPCGTRTLLPEAQLCLWGEPWAAPVTRRAVAIQAPEECLSEACATRGRRRGQAGSKAPREGGRGTQRHTPGAGHSLEGQQSRGSRWGAETTLPVCR